MIAVWKTQKINIRKWIPKMWEIKGRLGDDFRLFLRRYVSPLFFFHSYSISPRKWGEETLHIQFLFFQWDFGSLSAPPVGSGHCGVWSSILWSQDSFIVSLSFLCSQNATALASAADKRWSDCLDSASINFNPPVQHKAGCVLSPILKKKKAQVFTLFWLTKC